MGLSAHLYRGLYQISAGEEAAPIIFPLADEDAYAYCGQSPCLECVFRCKRGFILYAYLSGVGLAELPIDRMDPYWQTKPSSN